MNLNSVPEQILIVLLSVSWDFLYRYCYILTFDPAQKYYSKVIHQKEVTHSNGQ